MQQLFRGCDMRGERIGFGRFDPFENDLLIGIYRCINEDYFIVSGKYRRKSRVGLLERDEGKIAIPAKLLFKPRDYVRSEPIIAADGIPEPDETDFPVKHKITMNQTSSYTFA
jgi:hypothetical protein